MSHAPLKHTRVLIIAASIQGHMCHPWTELTPPPAPSVDDGSNRMYGNKFPKSVEKAA
jgi:hypothetical protein